MRNNRAFSLAEVLIVCALMSVITTFIVVIFNQSRATFELGSGRVSADSKVRETLLKLSPFLASSFGPKFTDDIYIPTANSATTTQATLYDNVVFSTTEDFLYTSGGFRYDYYTPNNPNMQGISALYPPAEPFSGSFNHFNYRIRFRQPAADAKAVELHPQAGDLILEYGTVSASLVFTPVVDSTHPASQNPRVLVRSTRDAAITYATFQRKYDTSQVVEMRLNVVSPVVTPTLSGRVVQVPRLTSVNSSGQVTGVSTTNMTRVVSMTSYANFNVACEALR